jgi:2-polyprenyl-3-methyl-5-hydroxy-6-metoxy-1,4-benzoquinol methylase
LAHEQLDLAFHVAPADVLISSNVLKYVDDLDHILAQFSRLVKPGSALVLSLPNLASLSRAFQRVNSSSRVRLRSIGTTRCRCCCDCA